MPLTDVEIQDLAERLAEDVDTFTYVEEVAWKEHFRDVIIDWNEAVRKEGIHESETE